MHCIVSFPVPNCAAVNPSPAEQQFLGMIVKKSSDELKKLKAKDSKIDITKFELRDFALERAKRFYTTNKNGNSGTLNFGVLLLPSFIDQAAAGSRSTIINGDLMRYILHRFVMIRVNVRQSIQSTLINIGL